MSWSPKNINWDTEPVAIIGLTKAILEVGAGAGLQVSGSTTAAIVADVTAVVTVLATFFARKQATSPATVAARQDATDAHLAAAGVALANAGPAVQNRARLCPGPVEPTPPGGFSVARETTVLGPPEWQADGDWYDWSPKTNDAPEPSTAPSFDPPASAAGPHPQYKLGRRVNHDEQSRQYAIVPMSAEKIASRRWARRAPVFDQGQVGSCTGNAAAGWVCTDDAGRQGIATLADGTAVDEKLAVAIYSAAETIDGDGPYPPNDNGSSGLSVAKVLKARGLCSGYLHAFSLAAVYSALQAGPGMAGTVWYNSMFDTATDGHIKVDKKSGEAGGHEYLIDELEVDGSGTVTKIWMQNSWDTGWGVGGRGYFTPAEFGALLAAQGDFTVPAPAVVPAPTPGPTPSPAPSPTPGPADSFPVAVAAYSGLADWLTARADKKGMTPDAYAAWVLAGEAHKR